jgi:hypothetical protein
MRISLVFLIINFDDDKHLRWVRASRCSKRLEDERELVKIRLQHHWSIKGGIDGLRSSLCQACPINGEMWTQLDRFDATSMEVRLEKMIILPCDKVDMSFQAAGPNILEIRQEPLQSTTIHPIRLNLLSVKLRLVALTFWTSAQDSEKKSQPISAL